MLNWKGWKTITMRNIYALNTLQEIKEDYHESIHSESQTRLFAGIDLNAQRCAN